MASRRKPRREHDTGISEGNGDGIDRLQSNLEQSRSLALCSKLVSGVVHEINNPLDGVINAIRLVKSGNLTPEREREYLVMIEAELFRIASLTKRLLGLSREHPLSLQPADVNELVEKSLFFVDYRMRLSGVTLRKSLAAKLPPVKADQTSLLQVFVNLLLNAIESMPEGGTLSVRTAADRKWVKVIVGDTGRGIADEDLNRIFHPFFTTKKDSGHGLGLAICLNILERHGGEISVDSMVGKGSIFTVRLPRR